MTIRCFRPECALVHSTVTFYRTKTGEVGLFFFFFFFFVIAAILAATKAFHLLPRLKNEIQQKWGKTRPASIRCPLITPLRRNSRGCPTLIVKMELSALTTHNFPREENCCMLHSKERAKNRVQRLYSCYWQCLNWNLIQYLLRHEAFWSVWLLSLGPLKPSDIAAY